MKSSQKFFCNRNVATKYFHWHISPIGYNRELYGHHNKFIIFEIEN